MSPENSNHHPLEVQLALDVKTCRICQWFWGGIPPYGPYPSFDWLDQFPKDFRKETPQTMNKKKSSLMKALLTGYKLVDPAIMHGCRKAPIMTMGINPNLTSFYKSSSSSAWAYPCFSDPANYAYYYRFQTIYQESADQDIITKNLIPGTEIKAVHDGWLRDVTRGFDHRWMEIKLQYKGETNTRSIELAWGTDARYVLRVKPSYGDISPDQKLSFKKGDTIAAKLDFPTGTKGQIYKNPTTYYQRFIKTLAGLTKHINNSRDAEKEVSLTIGEDVSQHDMVGCASPGWNDNYDIPRDFIAGKCVAEKAFAILQVLQSKPAILVIVGKSSMKMFGEHFGEYLDFDYRDKDAYHLLKETCARKRYLTIEMEGYQLKSRIIVCPHFSHRENYFRQARMSAEAWEAFKIDFPADAKVLIDNKKVKEHGYGDITAIAVQRKKDPLKKLISSPAWGIIMAYYFNPSQMMAEVLIEEYDQGNLAIDKSSGHLQRSDGPCSFCHNDLWNFIQDKGCLYENTTEQYPNGFLEDIADKIFKR